MEKVISAIQGLVAILAAIYGNPVLAGVMAALSIGSAILHHAERKS